MGEFSRETLKVLQAQSGDREAIQAVLFYLQTDLLRYISGLIGRQDAEDLLQEVLLQIYRNLKWLKQPELLRPWAYRIASRTCFAFLKRERRWVGMTSEQEIVESVPAPLDGEMRRVLSEMPELFEQTSAASRAVLVLHYIQRLELEEIAAVLDINIGTVKSRLGYGLACLRKILERGK